MYKQRRVKFLVVVVSAGWSCARQEEARGDAGAAAADEEGWPQINCCSLTPINMYRPHTPLVCVFLHWGRP